MQMRIAAVAFGLALVTAAPAFAADPIMPLSELREGMKCTGSSVIRGTDPTSFDVEILDVVDDRSAEGPRILVRVSGAAVDATGIGPGFSGSPIFCPGSDGTPRNAGAISESIGEYGGKAALATPIETLLAVPLDPPQAKSAATPGRTGRGRRPQGRSRAARLHGPPRRLGSALTISGVSPEFGQALARAGARHGRTFVTVPSAPLRPFPVVDLRPGSAVGVGLSGGDITVGAIGTVTYVDGDRVWAFGHPFDATGRRSLLLQDAYVYRVVNNPNQSADATVGTYKLAAAGHTVGTLSADVNDGVAGRKGAAPPTVPVHVEARDRDTGRVVALNARVADETDLGAPASSSPLGFVAPTAVTQAVARALGSAPAKATGGVCFRIVLREVPKPIGICNRYVASGEEGVIPGIGTLVAARAAQDLSAALSPIARFKLGRIHVKQVDVGVNVVRGVRQAFITRVRVPHSVRRGSHVLARVSFTHVGGGTETRTFPLRIPGALHRGPQTINFAGQDSDAASGDLLGTLTLTIGGGNSDNSGDPGPRTAAEVVRRIRRVQRWDGVRIRLGHRSIHAFRASDLRLSGKAAADVVVR